MKNFLWVHWKFYFRYLCIFLMVEGLGLPTQAVVSSPLSIVNLRICLLWEAAHSEADPGFTDYPVRGDLKDHLVPTALLEHGQGWDIYNFFGQLVPVPHSKEFLPDTKYFSLKITCHLLSVHLSCSVRRAELWCWMSPQKDAPVPYREEWDWKFPVSVAPLIARQMKGQSGLFANSSKPPANLKY